jgi:hypothetical protein
VKAPRPLLHPLPSLAWIAACVLGALVALYSGPRSVREASAEPSVGPGQTWGSGRTPMPGDAEVPLVWMPPGTSASPLPSEEIFPPQTIPIRFNHKKHVQTLSLSCKVCHAAAYTSTAASDRLLPKPAETCDNCHDADHSDPAHVRAGKEVSGQCSFCHVGANAGEGGQVAPVVMPAPNLRFPHGKHLARNIQCGQCHGQVGELELATREQLPRMAGCLACHGLSGAAEGGAKSACTTCHLAQPDGRLQTAFSGGTLIPPRWLHAAAHDADWIERHKAIAADDSAFCASCHTSKECTDCHDGNVRPRKVHPNDWLSMHPQAARTDNPRCSSCHQEQTFCGDCHRRVGVARDSPSGNMPAGRRFHPPPAEWTTAPRGPNHHSWEAMRNLNACVACHTERDCATCHATKGVAGGQGVDPHPNGFVAKCGTALRRNPRPCYVCHDSADPALRSCQ